ncbi:MAG: hypothetical protein VKQ33_10980 [Candidatus Sericytochromatia bacterium]|nr:hypothetical protein [Candidatus Sericytochromatia bacterium]
MTRWVVPLVVGLLGPQTGCAHAGLAGPRALEAGSLTITGRASVVQEPDGRLDPYTATDVASVAVSIWPGQAGEQAPLEAGEAEAIALGGVMGLDTPIVLSHLARQTPYRVRLRAYDWAGLRVDDGSTGCITVVTPAALGPADEVPLRLRLGDKAAPPPLR